MYLSVSEFGSDFNISSDFPLFLCEECLKDSGFFFVLLGRAASSGLVSVGTTFSNFFGLRGFLGESLCGVTSFLFLRDSLMSAYSVGMLCLKADRGVLSGVSVGVAFCTSPLFPEEQVLIKEMCQCLKPTYTAEQWAYLLEPFYYKWVVQCHLFL